MRSLRQTTLLTALAAVGALCAIGAAQASAAPVFNLEIHHNQTNFPPGGTAQYWFAIDNVGSSNTSGTVKLTVHLPAGLTRKAVTTSGAVFNGSGSSNLNLSWSCPGFSGTTTFSCTTTGVIPRHTLNRDVVVTVNVAPGAEGDLTTTAEVEGGGAAMPATASEPTQISPEPAGFGIVPGSFLADFFGADGLSTEREAGAHPDNLVVGFDFNSVLDTTQTTIQKFKATGNIRDLEVDLPPGFIGNPTAVGECSQSQFTVYACPASSIVGRFDGDVHHPQAERSHFAVSAPVYNMAHPRGSISDLAFVIDGNPVHVRVSLDAANHYAIVSKVANINETLPPFDSKVTIWGVPADPSHDSERCVEVGTTTISTVAECSAGIAEKPFLTLPEQCETESVMRLHNYDSWQETGVFGPEVDYPVSGKMTGCDDLRFEPELEIEPTGKQANTPTGLEVNVHVPQSENPDGRSTPPVKNTVVTLPAGMSFSPAFADGLTSCSSAQIKLGSSEPVECPDSSRIGEVSLSTPLLPKPIEGSIYLASQGDNPFGSLFALYLVVHDTEERGILIKIPGKIEVNQLTGQITTSFAETPQFPFEDLTLKFRSGARAPLVSPPSCGTQTIAGTMSSWAQPDDLLDVSNTYQVTEGPNGTPCPADPAHRPFAPKLTAGTLNPSAGAFSPFVLRLSREDDEQQLGQITTVLPPGLSAVLAGVPFCPESAIASISAVEGAGHSELEHPACPQASQIGTVSAGVGAGPDPDYFPGKVYLAGPYKGAPLSLVIVTPGLAGPYDLGNVVVRAALFVDPHTAQVTAVSDPLPTILHGVLLQIKDVRLRIDKPNFVFNPTSCAPMAVGGQIGSVGGSAQAAPSSRFQVGDCASLGFKPSFKVFTSGKTSKANGASLAVKLSFPPGSLGTEANIRSVKVDLPKQLPSRLTTLQKACTAAQFHTNPAGCPAASVVGHARAITSILPVPLEGPVYFVSNGGEAFPNLIMVLQGYGITIDLVGNTFISKTGITSSTFKTVPDQPVSSFELVLPQGPYSALTANGDLCTSKLSMPTEIIGQNGMLLNQTTEVNVTGCPKAKVLTRAQKLALALKACHKQHNHAKRKACERQARRKYGPPLKKAKKAKK